VCFKFNPKETIQLFVAHPALSHLFARWGQKLVNRWRGNRLFQYARCVYIDRLTAGRRALAKLRFGLGRYGKTYHHSITSFSLYPKIVPNESRIPVQPQDVGIRSSTVKIGNIQFASPFCQAGLAGYSDRAMRVVARRRGCAHAVTEALLDVILLNGGQGLKNSIDINDEDHPVAGQLIGSEAEAMARAAVILAQAGYDVIDLNFACPVKKIKNKARGGYMLGDVARAVEILKAVRDALPANTPSTVSLRRAMNDSREAEDWFNQIIEAAWATGYAAARVHGRTVEQKYQGRAKWQAIQEIKRRYPNRTILGSGDVFSAQDAVRMLSETGVDGVWIARGAIGNPWIFEHARLLLADPSVKLEPPTIGEQRQALAEHFAIAMEIHGEALAGRRMRKMGIKYSRFHPEAEAVKNAFIATSSLREWTAVLDRWYGRDGSGVWPSPLAADEVNDEVQSCEPMAAS
jgi:tRNA-dihydrouridine synthase B